MFCLKDQKGIAPIAILVILILVTATAVFVSKISKNKLLEQKANTVELKGDVEASPTASPNLSSQPTQLQPASRLTPRPMIPTPLYSPSPTPTPTPEIRQPILTTRVNLGRSHSDMPESASGDGVIRLMSADPYMGNDAKIASLQYDFNLRGLEVEKEYLISICTIQEGGDCVGLSAVKTDKSGNASYSGNSGITITKDRPFKAIKVTHQNGGFCSNSGSPCLRGELSLGIQF